VEDYISDEGSSYVEISFSDKVAEHANTIIMHSRSRLTKKEHLNLRLGKGSNQWIINDLLGGTGIMMEPNETYDWHFDAIDYEKGIDFPVLNNYYSKMTYLTSGEPLELGGWTKIHKSFAPRDLHPNVLLARIYPKAGKIVKFPAFMVHRVPKTSSERWAIWSTEMGSSEDYRKLWVNYFFRMPRLRKSNI